MTDSRSGPPSPLGMLPQRIAAWERIVTEVEAGYNFGLDDWLNDMDLRRGIDEVQAGLTSVDWMGQEAVADQLADIDRRFIAATRDAGKCLWGSRVAAREGWHPDRQWWYFRRPRAGNAGLDAEIDNVR